MNMISQIRQRIRETGSATITPEEYDLLQAEWIKRVGLTPEPSTPSSDWHAAGEPDPHEKHYDCERAALTMGYLSDDELANAAFLHYDVFPSMNDVLSGKAHMPIAYMTAVKDRIRWLSRKLVEATAPKSE